MPAQPRRVGVLEDGPLVPAPHRVASLDELRQRIFKGIEEMNAQPVHLQWKSFDFQMT